MIKITLYEHPLAAVAPRVFEVDSLGEWLLGHYGPVPTVTVQVFAGEPSAATEITGNIKAILACDEPEYVVLQSPGGFDPFTWVMIIAAVTTVAMVLLMPKPEMPGNINRTQQSPNNALGSRENKVRLLERVEDIFGTVKSIPSLMMPTYNKYIAHQKYEYGYYCVGRGYHSLAELRDGDTLIADINGASAAQYDPFTSPNSGDAPVLQIGDAIIDDIITASRAIEVDGITLKALNQVQLAASGSYTFASSGLITQAAKQPNFNAVAAAADTITITMSPATVVSAAGAMTANAAAKTFSDDTAAGLFNAIQAGDVVTMAGWLEPANNAAWTVVTKTTNLLTVTAAPTNETAAEATASVQRDYSGTYTLASVDDGTATVTAATWPTLATVTCAIAVDGKSEYTDWVTLPDADRTEVWCNIIAANGLYKDSGGKSIATVDFEIEIEQLDQDTLLPLGSPVVETVNGALTGSVSDERADTIEHATAWTGAARVRMRRTTAYDYSFSGTVVDEIKWADLYSISPVAALEFGNKTTIHTITQATARATAVKSRQLNCLASRLLPTYNGTVFSGAFDSTGLLVSGTIAATSKLCDIIAAVSQDPRIGARVLADEVDMAQIWGVQQALDAWSTECGQFNYTFDSDNTSFEETLIMIANAGFCIAYRQNGKIRLALDQAQATSTALFTHRNKKPGAETLTRRFASNADYDGVEFVYVDPDSDQSETITLPLDGSYTKVKKFEIPGIRSFDQAWLRANREYNKLLGQRITLETTTTLDARSLLPNARIDVVDNTRFKSYDGEVIAQSGLELTLSQAVAFTPSLPHSIVLMRRDGTLESITCTAGSAANKVVLQSLPSEAITTTHGADGIRTIYSFAADSARGAMAYLVQEIDLSDGQYATVRAINYSAAYYSADLEAIPAKATVINGPSSPPVAASYLLTEYDGHLLTEDGNPFVLE
jgi:hypothetical protein